MMFEWILMFEKSASNKSLFAILDSGHLPDEAEGHWFDGSGMN
jgi:hypothetical protein